MSVDPLAINGGKPISTLDELVLALFDIQAVCFGHFELKSGITSPIYIDLRLIVSYPTVLQAVSDQMWAAVSECRFDVVCGVPYTALPIATILSLQHKRPMVMRRKEAKTYGLKKSIEGVFRAGQTCLVIEDLVTSGLSVFETVQPLNEVGLKVTDVVVLVDREQGGRSNLSNSGLVLHSVVSISSMLSILTAARRIDEATADAVKQFITKNQVQMTPATTPVLKTATLAKRASVEENKIAAPASASSSSSSASSVAPTPTPSGSVALLSYTVRASHCRNPIGQQLFKLMDDKQTNLCLSIDLTNKQHILAMVDQIGPYICVLKTHVDIVEDFDDDFIKQLVALSVRHNFLLFEDRKFADIGNTVTHQYGQGIYHIADWAHITNAHALPGPGIIDGLKQVGQPKGRGLLLLGEMSSKGNLATGAYTHATVAMAEANDDFVFGFISQHKLSTNPGFMYLTPGVQMTEQGTASSGDGLGQQYNTPASVIGDAESDVIIVGRAIYAASNPAEQAKRYQKHAWDAYQQRLAKP